MLALPLTAASRPNEATQPGRDFKKLNRMAIIKGSGLTPTQVADFRRTHDARLRGGSMQHQQVRSEDPRRCFFFLLLLSSSSPPLLLSLPLLLSSSPPLLLLSSLLLNQLLGDCSAIFS